MSNDKRETSVGGWVNVLAGERRLLIREMNDRCSDPEVKKWLVGYDNALSVFQTILILAETNHRNGIEYP